MNVTGTEDGRKRKLDGIMRKKRRERDGIKIKIKVITRGEMNGGGAEWGKKVRGIE